MPLIKIPIGPNYICLLIWNFVSIPEYEILKTTKKSTAMVARIQLEKKIIMHAHTHRNRKKCIWSYKGGTNQSINSFKDFRQNDINDQFLPEKKTHINQNPKNQE